MQRAEVKTFRVFFKATQAAVAVEKKVHPFFKAGGNARTTKSICWGPN
jgi:hypothetical protein